MGEVRQEELSKSRQDDDGFNQSTGDVGRHFLPGWGCDRGGREELEGTLGTW